MNKRLFTSYLGLGWLPVAPGTWGSLAPAVLFALLCYFGVPKFMVSANAGLRGFSSRYFGHYDITMMHTVVDVAGLSDPLRFLITQAAGAICGMVESTPDREMLFTRDKPAIAICELMILSLIHI